MLAHLVLAASFSCGVKGFLFPPSELLVIVTSPAA